MKKELVDKILLLKEIAGDGRRLPGPFEAGEFERTLDQVLESIEELQAAEEELRVQNEELASARDRLERRRLRYADLFEFAPDAYVVTDMRNKITEANQAAARLFGIRPAHLVGKPLSLYIAAPDRLGYLGILPLLQERERLEWEGRIQRRDGKVFPAGVSLAVVRDGGRPVALRCLIRDLTQQKSAEEARRRHEGQLLASAANDAIWATLRAKSNRSSAGGRNDSTRMTDGE